MDLAVEYVNPDSILREGYTVRGLPLIPPVSLLAEIPVLADQYRNREKALAERALHAIVTYNCILKLVVQPGHPELWKLSAEIVEQTMKINEVVEKAHEEADGLTEGLLKRMNAFKESVVFRENHFRDGSWACKCHYCGLRLPMIDADFTSPSAGAFTTQAGSILHS